MKLRKLIKILSAAIGLAALASAASLILITSYLHRLTGQVDSNLQGVRAAEEIQLQLLWHARTANQANLLRDPASVTAADEARAAVYRWLEQVRRYVDNGPEQELAERLAREIDAYFAEHAALALGTRPALDRYVEGVAPFKPAYDAADELLHINIKQAAAATRKAHRVDVVARVVGFSVAVLSLLFLALFVVGVRSYVYRPLIALRRGMARYAARDYSARVPEQGATEIREIARSFNEIAAELQRQRATQLAFVAGVAHDLRNPLAAMKVAVEVLSSTDSSTPERQSQVTGMIARQIDILTRMLSDLLDAARVEAGEFSIVPRPCDARDLATQAVQLFAGASPLHELRVDLPDTALPVRCDALRLGQVLNNLISNAIKYSPQGGPVTVAARRKGERIEIEVSDNGPGIPAEERTRIFEPFRRIESSAASIPGVGIGLSVARRIVEAHGGEITLRSDTARGSTFVISLPSAFAAAPAQMQVLEALSA